MRKKMYELALFAGAGGGILGSMLSGHTCIGAVEYAEYPRKVLMARQRDGFLPKFPIWDDVSTFRIDNDECREYIELLKSKADELCISGGFPCQDISSAGKGAGITADTRSGLWFEMARIIDEIRPRNVFVENSPMLTSRGLGSVLGDLAELGDNAKWGVLGGEQTYGCCKRERLWIYACTNKERHARRRRQEHNIQEQQIYKNIKNNRDKIWSKAQQCLQISDWKNLFRSNGFRDGSEVADRMDRLAAVGNGQDPRLVRTILEMFKD